MTPAEALAVLLSMRREHDNDNRERIPYDGPEPDDPWLSDSDMDVAALRDEDATDRSHRWFQT